VLIAQSEHGRAGYAVMGFVTVTKFMGHPFSLPINGLEIAHKETVACFVDRALLVAAFHGGISASKVASKDVSGKPKNNHKATWYQQYADITEAHAVR
jgi:hypothetical protein